MLVSRAGGRRRRQLGVHLLELEVRKANLAAAAFQELPVQRGEQPRLRPRRLAQLVAVPRPFQKGLLHEVARQAFFPRQAERETKERRVMEIH